MLLGDATTPSLDAWKAYASASRVRFTTGAGASRPLFERAVAIDPNFASAHARLGLYYSTIGESALSRDSILRAHRLRDRVSDVERFFIDTLYDRDVTGNLERELRTLETWAQTYPRDSSAHGLAAGFATRSTGKYARALDEANKAMALDPDPTPPHLSSKAYGELFLNRIVDAEATVGRGRERGFDEASFFVIPYFIAVLKGDVEATRRTAALARGKRPAEDLISHLESLALARSARLQDARQASAVAVDVARSAGQRERAALFELATAVWDAFYGNAAAARQRSAAVLERARGRDVDFAAAFALAMAGDVPRARTLSGDLEKNLPEDTSVQYLYLPALRALFSLNARDPAEAIQALQTASRYDLARGGIGFIAHFGVLYPIYVRGLACLAANQPAQAAAEFQRILDHRSIVLVDPVDAMARLQLARALALSGDTVKAKTAYTDLLTLWKNADPGIPVVEQARAEYARLP
jgi:tetratricopeptide (TPR) repeat protein